MRNHIIIGLTFFLVALHGCASRSVVVNYAQLQIPAEINLKLDSGENITGIAIKKSVESLTIRKSTSSQELEINRNKIVEIKKLNSIFDEKGSLIPQQEINDLKNGKNSLIYTISGGAFSFGGSLLISSFALRSSDTEFKIVNPISIAGGILGVVLFNRIGNHRDYEMAVDRAKENRKLLVEQQLKIEQNKIKKIQEQIRIEQDAKAKLEEERKKLENKLKKKKNR